MKIPAILTILCLQSGLLFSQNIDSATFYFDKGTQAEKNRLFAVAAKSFEKAILFNQNYSEAYISNGNVNLEMRKLNVALVNFTKAYELQPGNKEIIKQLATLYFNNRQFQKAIDFSEKCNDCPDADRIKGVSYYNLEDYGKAQNFLQKAMSKNDQDAEAAYTLGRTYIELENEKAAIPLYQKAISLEPTRNGWMYELGLIYYSQDDYKNALKYINLAGDSGYNKSNDFYENQGFAQIYTGDINNGIKTLNEVLKRKPNNKELINNMANALYETKHYDEALTYFTKLLDLNPKDAASLYMVGMTFQKKGDKQKGQKICDKAIE
ncbi:MAG: tetratricopeptide repeat protein, partial [Bacteroidota bacterium]|nr:tetratricopeptide repeat protein [Bacteroidota bacterium]